MSVLLVNIPQEREFYILFLILFFKCFLN